MSEPKKIGRPLEFTGRVQVATRLTSDVHLALKDAAQKAGRSLSEEIEVRIKASFDQPALIKALAEQLLQDIRSDPRCPIFGEVGI